MNMVWWGDAIRAQMTEKALDLFRSSTGLEVSTEYQSGTAYDDKLAVRFAGGNPPDLLAVRRETLRDFAGRKALRPLPVGQVIIIEGVPPSVLNAGKIGNVQYGVPFGVASNAWVINTELFAKYKVDVPDLDTWDWDTLKETAAEVTRASGKKVWGATYTMDDILALGVWLRQRGLDLWTPEGRIAFTADSIAEWFQTWVDLRDAGAIPGADDIEELGLAAEQTPVGRKLAASAPIPSNSLAAFNATVHGALKMGFFPGESQADQRGHQLQPVGHWSVSARSKAPDAAFELLDFLINNTKANKELGVGRGAQIKKSVADQVASTLGKDDRIASDYTLRLAEFDLVDPAPDPQGSAELLLALGTISDKVAFGKSSPSKAAAEFFGKARSIIGG
ncbi:extracellular solute-binding protein family 1 [Streptomyces bingchenggensis BCW-1]|uniref:Extracellular solute-binding protein family 1 n=1 Tax=Streptomyces bingchenggensis (strain BCW-1) TaxID=749414 RepID=D7BUF7_STRBB|nr:extracellular solute-binding protein family 1 [Streptomyces bingchenggensis BCW-1]